MRVLDKTTRAIFEHAAEAFPEECCGVVTQSLDVIPLKNVAADPLHSFAVSPEDYLPYVAGALYMYHSHPNGAAVASEGDEECVERLRLPLMIVSWPEGKVRLLGSPVNHLEITGRPFLYGVFDCFTVLRDFYLKEFDIRLPNLTRPRPEWWLDNVLYDPFSDCAEQCNLVDSPGLAYGDIIFFTRNGSMVPNHAAVYVGQNRILHHGLGSFSGSTDYNTMYRDSTVRILRHVDRS